MAIHSLFPAYVEINYHSAYGPHTMTRPTRAWTGIPWESPGAFAAWDGSERDADSMISALIELMLPLYTPAVIFDRFTIYTLASVGAEPVPVWAEILEDKVGSAGAAQYATAQKTFNFLSTSSAQAKLILLDVPIGGGVSKAFSVSGAELALVNLFMADSEAWSARDDGQPVAFRSLSNGFNDALKRRYRL